MRVSSFFMQRCPKNGENKEGVNDRKGGSAKEGK
ncbi:hypothetical protein I656_00940 [Geobacillus sp. WSUCF1]|nr:hypothetical protein I656_00940 [Geobacillus sp. WSUCF1]